MLKAELRSFRLTAPALDRLERTWQGLRLSAQTQNRTVFAVSSLMAISALSHVPAHLLWLSKALRSAAAHGRDRGRCDIGPLFDKRWKKSPAQVFPAIGGVGVQAVFASVGRGVRAWNTDR